MPTKFDFMVWLKLHSKPKKKKKKSLFKQNKWREIDFHFGDIVQTKDGFDRGLVTKVDKNGMPIEILSSPGSANYTEPRYYGGVESVKWYKTGGNMTPQEWYELYSTEEGWQRYCEDRRNQTKF